MKIYTKTGDKGSTSLLGGHRVSKAHLRIDAYGTVDELSACLGLLRDQEANKKRAAFVISIQEQLFAIGAQLAVGPGGGAFPLPAIDASLIQEMELAIDEMAAALPPMKNFILPGGHPAISIGHMARTVCRRAERLVVRLADEEKTDDLIVPILNRLSDYLFMLCRQLHQELNVDETPWTPRKQK